MRRRHAVLTDFGEFLGGIIVFGIASFCCSLLALVAWLFFDRDYPSCEPPNRRVDTWQLIDDKRVNVSSCISDASGSVDAWTVRRERNHDALDAFWMSGYTAVGCLVLLLTIVFVVTKYAEWRKREEEEEEDEEGEETKED